MQPQEKPQGPWSYADYLTWPDEQRWEVIDGVAYAMSPAPTILHQRISWELARQIGDCLKGRDCQGLAAPFDLRLTEPGANAEETHTVVQPDLAVFCDPAKLDTRGAVGAPDLVIEILSPATSSKDTIIKRRLYEANRVPEYWIVDPSIDQVFVFTLEGERYGYAQIYRRDDQVTSQTIPAVTVALAEVFPERPEEEPAVREVRI